MSVGASRAGEQAVEVARTELAWEETPGGFRCRITGASGGWSYLVPLAVAGLALLAALAGAAGVAVGMLVLGLVLFPRKGGHLHGIRVEGGNLVLLGPDQAIPLHHIRRVDLTASGLSLQLAEAEPIHLQLIQSLGARAWLAERIRDSVVAHGDFDDVPAALARLRGEADA